MYAHCISIKLEEKQTKTNLTHDFLPIKRKRNNTRNPIHFIQFPIPPMITTCKTYNNTIRKLRLIQPHLSIQISQVFLILVCVYVYLALWNSNTYVSFSSTTPGTTQNGSITRIFVLIFHNHTLLFLIHTCIPLP